MDTFWITLHTVFQMVSLMVHLFQKCFNIVLLFHIGNPQGWFSVGAWLYCQTRFLNTKVLLY